MEETSLNQFDCFGTVHNFFTNCYSQLQEYHLKKKSICSEEEVLATKYRLITTNQVSNIHKESIKSCSKCKSKIFESIIFSLEPLVLLIEPSVENKMLSSKSFKKVIEFNSGSKYQLICCVGSSNDGGHFVSVFYLNQNFYFVDDTKSNYF